MDLFFFHPPIIQLTAQFNCLTNSPSRGNAGNAISGNIACVESTRAPKHVPEQKHEEGEGKGRERRRGRRGGSGEGDTVQDRLQAQATSEQELRNYMNQPQLEEPVLEGRNASRCRDPPKAHLGRGQKDKAT